MDLLSWVGTIAGLLNTSYRVSSWVISKKNIYNVVSTWYLVFLCRVKSWNYIIRISFICDKFAKSNYFRKLYVKLQFSRQVRCTVCQKSNACKRIALHKSLSDLLHLLLKNVHRFEPNYLKNYWHDKFENTITHVASVGTFPIARVLIIQS